MQEIKGASIETKKARAPRSANRSYAGRSIDDLKIERRERLLTAAYAILGSEGYAQLSIERVCASARVATRHYYEHFQGREALLHMLYDRIESEVWQVVTKALTEPAADVETRTSNAICAFVRHALADPRRARIMCLESVGVSVEMEARRRLLHRRFAELIHQVSHQMASAGLIVPANYRLQGMALVGATNELLVEWLSGDTGIGATEMEAQVLTIFHALIKSAAYLNRVQSKLLRPKTPKPKASQPKKRAAVVSAIRVTRRRSGIVKPR